MIRQAHGVLVRDMCCELVLPNSGVSCSEQIMFSLHRSCMPSCA